MADLLSDRYMYVFVLLLLAMGLYGMFALRNLAKKAIGMTVFTTAIYLFFIEGSVKQDATVPVIDPAIGSDPAAYVDPLPHLLILTAIVVGVGILGVALALLVRIYQAHGTFDENEVVARLSGTWVEASESGSGSDGSESGGGSDGSESGGGSGADRHPGQGPA